MAYITINRQNFYHNLNQIIKKTGDKEKIAIVLKDNAYGHGILLMAKLASEFGITQAVVRNISEADKIKNLFRDILILGDSIIRDERYSFVINSLQDIEKAQIGANIELKVDTGMHRNGIAFKEIDEALTLVKKRDLNLIGVMTHYRSADELSSELFWQQKEFEKVKEKFKDLGYKNLRYHSHNSPTILRVNSFDEDLVRVGIGAYGYNELPTFFDKISLKPVLNIYANRCASRVVKKGARVGYGGAFIATQEMIISTYNLGYGDGWIRGEYTTPNGLNILGKVSMDYISLESDDKKICILDNAQQSAEQLNTISYEVLTRLSPSIARIIV
ncbi:MAG: alanine racemase [Sulfurovum sp.]